MRLLLEHQDPLIASAAAKGEWNCNPEGTIRLPLYPYWRAAFINKVAPDYWMKEVFPKYPDIAFEWVIVHIKDISWIDYSEDVQAVSSDKSLSDQNKFQILNKIDPDFRYANLIKTLVDDDLSLYRALLENESLSVFHLEPLYGNPDNEIWISKAKEALDKGYKFNQIAAAAIYGIGGHVISWSGHQSAMWKEWADRFRFLQRDNDARIKEIGNVGIIISESKQKIALEEERIEDIYGYDDQRRRFF